MKLQDLITACEDEMVMQHLDECVSNATAARGHTKVTFGTTEMQPVDLLTAGKKVGFIVWLPREKVTELLKKKDA
jgi:hypothetical protein